jgi:glyoxylase I family protein
MVKTMMVTAWAHTALTVRDLDRAIAFYRAAFGYELLFEERGMAAEIAAITGIAGQSCDLAQLRSPVSGHVLELIQFHGHEHVSTPEPVAPLRPGQAHVAFVVEDLVSALATVEALGARRIGEIALFPEGRAAYLVEPSGTFFELEELSEDRK